MRKKRCSLHLKRKKEGGVKQPLRNQKGTQGDRRKPGGSTLRKGTHLLWDPNASKVRKGLLLKKKKKKPSGWGGGGGVGKSFRPRQWNTYGLKGGH